jgi:hypothetical protein
VLLLVELALTLDPPERPGNDARSMLTTVPLECLARLKNLVLDLLRCKVTARCALDLDASNTCTTRKEFEHLPTPGDEAPPDTRDEAHFSRVCRKPFVLVVDKGPEEALEDRCRVPVESLSFLLPYRSTERRDVNRR